ncbi:MAG TPA: glycosyltransferase family 2 protein, partial [Candidatus Acidoferrales bacterium]|nr:glycosyltransferase family 2 protein [Candidatus Acidoferrales bacterium]
NGNSAHGLSRIARRGGNGNGNGNGNGSGNGRGNGGGPLSHDPFVSIHVAAYNEKRVIQRLLQACDQLDYPNYEVVVVDDSTDESLEILNAWRDRPRFKVLHRATRKGFKGGALQDALKLTDVRAEYVLVWDADSLPFPDSIQRFLPYFYEPNGNGAGDSKRRELVAAVQSYQWHVLNKSESWLTEGVRAEYAGSYLIERPFQEALGSLKMVAGTSYMIRADVLREVGWGTSLTEDWELTLKLYARGYKVVYTPYAECPAECVGTFIRLARQRMRWAEGHSHNVRRWFFPILLSPSLTPAEKLEFLFYSTYYLQALFFIVGSLCWLVSEIGLHAHVPDWTALLGWSLLLSNLFSLPVMNLSGLVLEEAPGKDLVGVLGALALSYLLVPFQAWAAVKGLLRREEGPWYRTPKTGRITDPVRHLRRLRLLGRWLIGAGRGRSGGPVPHRMARRPARRAGWMVAGGLALALAAVAVSAVRAPVAEANSGSQFWLHGNLTGPTVFDTTAPGLLVVKTVAFTSPCVPACPERWTGGDAGSALSTSAAQTVFAGTYSFDYWTAAGVTDATISWTFEYGDNAGCTTNPVVIAQNSSFTLLAGHTGGTPVSVVTTSSNTSVPAGKFFCLVLDFVSGGPTTLQYDSSTGPTNFLTPSVIFIPEQALALVGLALVAPVSMRLWKRRPHAPI